MLDGPQLRCAVFDLVEYHFGFLYDFSEAIQVVDAVHENGTLWSGEGQWAVILGPAEQEAEGSRELGVL